MLVSLCLVALALPLVQCRVDAPYSPEQVVVIGTTEDFENVNELIVGGSSFNNAVVHRLFLSLVDEQDDFTDGPPTFAPRLAKSWQFSDDRLQLTFELRDDVMWSDGVPVTAEDVRFTWQAHRSPEVAWTYSFVKEPINDVEVVDDHTVRFHFDRVSATQLLDANEGVILPRHVWSQLPFDQWRAQPEWFQQNLVVNGPFDLVSFKLQQELELRANERYYEPGLPRFERVLFRHVRDPNNLVGQLTNGSLDFIHTLNASEADRVDADKDLTLLDFETRQYTFVTWNTQRPQFADAEVRRALALAIDRQTIVDTIWYGYARVGSSPIVSSVWAHNRDIEPWPYDPERARTLLERNGWIDSDGDGVRDKDGVAFSFELTTTATNQERWDTAQMIAAQLKEVGIEARPRRIEFRTLNALNLEHDYDATIGAFLIDTSLDMSYSFHSTDGGYNYGQYSNPEVDRLTEIIRSASDLKQVEAELHQLQSIIHHDQPMLFLWEPRRILAHRSDLRNVNPNAISEYSRLREWSRQSG